MSYRKLLFASLLVVGLALVTVLAAGCGVLQLGPTPTPTNTPTPTHTPTPIHTPTPTNTPTPIPTPTPAAPPTAKEFPIVTDDKIQNHPAIFGDYVVWADHRNESVDIYAYNLATEEETRITTYEEQDAFPVLANDLVVWLRQGDFYGYHLGAEDAEEFSVVDYESISAGCPAGCTLTFSGLSMALAYGARAHVGLSERVLVWSDEETEDVSDIFAFDLEKEARIRITDDAASQEWPAAAGNLIIWKDERNDEGDIYAYDLDTQEEFPIVTAPLTQSMPSTDGSLVVWVDERDGGYDIYGYDLATQAEFPIATGPVTRTLPGVWGNFVIWMADDGDDWNIYGYDLQVGEEFPIVVQEGWQGNPRIWGDVVVWTNGGGNPDIYGARLEY